MEADGVTLSDAEVRERFSAFHDGELSSAEAAFVRKRLDEDKALAAEYETFTKIMTGLAGLNVDPDPNMKPGVAPASDRVDLLADVQSRLHKRSGGKFYRTRWSRWAGVMPLEAIAGVMLLLLLLVYVSMTYISGLRPAGEGTAPVPVPPQESQTPPQTSPAPPR